MTKKIIRITGLILTSCAITFIITMLLLDSSGVPKGYITHEIQSEILKEKREIIVKLPRDYVSNEKKEYPVLYVVGGNSLTYNIAYDIDLLFRTGYLQSLIIVGIPNISQKTRQRDLTPPFLKQDHDDTNSSLGRANYYLNFIEKEVIPLIESKYKTNNERIAIGNSREGLFVTFSLLEKPGLFTGRLALSPALWRENDLMVQRFENFLNETDSLNSFFFICMGTNEVDKMKNAFNKTLDILKKDSNKNKIKWFGHYTPNATHQDNAKLSAPLGIMKYFETTNLTE